MDENVYHVGIEMTSHSIKLVTGFILNDLVYVVDCIEEECAGLSKGMVSDADEVIKTVKSIISKTAKNLSINVKGVTLAIPPINLLCQTDTGTTNTIDGNDVIKHVDIANILTSMKKRNFSDPDLKIIDIIPDSYFIGNNERYSYKPVGKVSKVISLHASIYAMSEKIMNQFTGCIVKAGYEVDNLVISPYATALYLSNINAVPNNYILLDIGEEVTTISKIHKGTAIVKSKLLHYGGKNITAAISNRLNIPYNDAKLLKEKYGMDNNMIIPVKVYGDYTLQDINDAINCSLKPAFTKFAEEIKEQCDDDNENLPVVITGGTANLYNIDKVALDAFKTEIVNFNVETMGARNKAYVTVLGLIKYAGNNPQVNDDEPISTQINRVQKKNNSYKFDEEL